ncbi:MAG: hypothetical protein ACMG6S_34975 [Byssovorax sp.]
MRALPFFPLLLLLPLASACSGTGANGEGVGGNGGSPRPGEGGSTSVGQTSDVSSAGGNTGPGGAAAGTTVGSGSGGGPVTCEDVNGSKGCCDTDGVLHYCNSKMNIVNRTCPAGQVCGWSTTGNYYECVAPPATSDPSAQVPMACGGGSSSTTGGGSVVTWTQIYGTIFGPQGTSSCSKNGVCHTVTKDGFKCGTTKDTCYAGFVSSGMVIPGAAAASSDLVTTVLSPLCGPLGGTMPMDGKCTTAAQVAQIKAWLSNGGQND